MTMTLRQWAVVFTVVASASACGGSDNGNGTSTGKTTGSCDVVDTSEHFCTEWTFNFTAEQTAQLRTACTQGNTHNGTWGSGCPTAGRLGACTLSGSNAAGVPATTAVKMVFFAPTTLEDAKNICSSSQGTWSTQ